MEERFFRSVPLKLSKKLRGQAPLNQIERGGMYVALGFFGAQAQKKQFRPSENRPENPQIFMERVKKF